MFTHTKRGDEVAVLPVQWARSDEVLEISWVRYAGPMMIEIADGRRYLTSDGRALNSVTAGCIVPVEAEHRAAIEARRCQTIARD